MSAVAAVRTEPTIGSTRRELAALLRAAWGASAAEATAGLDAKILLAHVLGIDSAEIALREDESISSEMVSAVRAMIDRRARGEPVARIVGEKEFWSLKFQLSPETLVPRPETETLVEAALNAFSDHGRRDAPLRIVDLGTGSGCILLALLSELPNAVGLGVDRAEGAVRTARRNARRLGLGHRAVFAVGDWASAISGPFDAVLANPPYVEERALPDLPVEVIGHDPRLALAGGSDGLDGYRRIVPALPRLLRPDGFAAMEIGPDQAAPVRAMAAAEGLSAEVKRDLAGRDRVTLLTLV